VSTKRNRDIAERPNGAYGKLRPTRPGEYLLMDTTRLDVFALDPVPFTSSARALSETPRFPAIRASQSPGVRDSSRASGTSIGPLAPFSA
jgi:hypothetical protein